MLEEPQRGVSAVKRRRRLSLSVFEQVLIGAMLLVLAVASIDAVEGRHVGKSDALAVAKLQGQQELMASVFRVK